MRRARAPQRIGRQLLCSRHTCAFRRCSGPLGEGGPSGLRVEEHRPRGLSRHGAARHREALPSALSAAASHPRRRLPPRRRTVSRDSREKDVHPPGWSPRRPGARCQVPGARYRGANSQGQPMSSSYRRGSMTAARWPGTCRSRSAPPVRMIHNRSTWRSSSKRRAPAGTTPCGNDIPRERHPGWTASTGDGVRPGMPATSGRGGSASGAASQGVWAYRYHCASTPCAGRWATRPPRRDRPASQPGPSAITARSAGPDHRAMRPWCEPGGVPGAVGSASPRGSAEVLIGVLAYVSTGRRGPAGCPARCQ